MSTFSSVPVVVNEGKYALGFRVSVLTYLKFFQVGLEQQAYPLPLISEPLGKKPKLF